MMNENESGDLFPKSGLRGSLHREWKRCGRKSCRCSRGHLHGPYWYRRWRDGGVNRSEYVPENRVQDVAEEIATWKDRHPPIHRMRNRLAAMRRFERGLAMRGEQA